MVLFCSSYYIQVVTGDEFMYCTLKTNFVVVWCIAIDFFIQPWSVYKFTTGSLRLGARERNSDEGGNASFL